MISTPGAAGPPRRTATRVRLQGDCAPCLPAARAPCILAPLRRLATEDCEKSELDRSKSINLCQNSHTRRAPAFTGGCASLGHRSDSFNLFFVNRRPLLDSNSSGDGLLLILNPRTPQLSWRFREASLEGRATSEAYRSLLLWEMLRKAGCSVTRSLERKEEINMHSIIYVIGLVVVVIVLARYFGVA